MSADEEVEFSPASQATLEQLEDGNWFSSVGQPVAGDEVRVLSSWEEAITQGGSASWIQRKLDALSTLRFELMQNDSAHIDRWEEILQAVEITAVDVAHWHCYPLIENEGVPEELLDLVVQDVRGMLFEAEFSEIITPGFHAGLGYWYLNGHFPCGVNETQTGTQVLVY
ncbi:hypothetical protein [Calycomorphotria hydatis]|uniref:Uncharacterized protein n=1 Tax=Calycomorphotria hydatis TaxID=2528027 RepID=A0A517T9X8_9PLAN|nr:hypothetical protein [Calycomorphotria hydatis]QDT65181.1 hypothetical protein V22_24280 [Calycomorphotria hydatis]